jgi:hypothetical protein
LDGFCFWPPPCSLVNAEIIFSSTNSDPPAFGTSGFWGVVAGCPKGFSFQVPPGRAWRVDQVKAAGFCYASSAAPTVTFLIMSDAGGKPGSQLAYFNVTGFTTAAQVVTAASTSAIILVPGQTYWFLASPSSGQLNWSTRSCTSCPTAKRTYWLNDDWVVDSGLVGSFAILGTPVSQLLPAAVSPAAGSGLSQTLAFSFNDPLGWQDLDVVNILIHSVLDGRNACYLAYSRSAGALYLVPDAGGGLLPGLALGGAGSTANSQCTVGGAGSSAESDGNVLTLNLALTFSAAFAGNKVIYMAARDRQGGNSGWQGLGTWNVAGAAATGPAVTGVNPPRSSNSSQTYTFTFSDSSGWGEVSVANVLINSAIDGRQAC